MATTKGQTIADYAVSKIGCAYIYGGYGEKRCSPAFRRERAQAYPDYKANMYKYCPVLSGKQSACSGCKYNGKQAYDCAQLTRYCTKAAGQELVSGANSQWKKTAWDKQGTIDSLPDVPGVLLYYRNKNGVMSHTGVYIGGGYGVEARGHAYGVVKTKVASRIWTHWAALSGVLPGEVINNPTKPEEPKETAPEAQTGTNGAGVLDMSTLRNGARGQQVRALQKLLNASGYDAGKVDGIWGKNTLSAVKAYQRSAGLEADGVVGKKTWTKLLA